MKKFILFLILNFGALFLGALLMGSPAENQWYQHINKAPWTPPGWTFGAAWFTIMLLFSWYLARNYKQNIRIWPLMYVLHLILNISWNPIFFQEHFVVFGLLILILLFFTVCWFLWMGKSGFDKVLMLPYFVWLIIAGSLNAFIWWYN